MDETGEECRRCGRKAPPGWRCTERALSGKSVCERHFLYNQKKTERWKEGASGITPKRRSGRRKPVDNSENGVVDDGCKELFGDPNGTPTVVDEFTGLCGVSEGDAGVNLNLGCESLNLQDKGEEGQQVHSGGFGEGCGRMGQVLGDYGVEYAEDRNAVAGLGAFRNVGNEDHGCVAGRNVCVNDRLGLPSEGIESLIGEEPGFGSFQALLCKARGCAEDVIFIGDVTGFEGLSGENTHGFRDEVGGFVENPCFEGENDSNKEGPGSNYKMSALGFEEEIGLLLSRGGTTNEEARCEALRPLSKRGRPKGSKNENDNKQLSTALDGQSVGGDDNAGTIGMSSVTDLGIEIAVLSGEKDKSSDEVADLGETARAEKSGRPKVSKNKIRRVEHVGNVVAVKIVGPKKHGRPKSSKCRKKNIMEAGDEAAGEIGGDKKLGRPKGSLNKLKNTVDCNNEGSGAGEIVRPKKRGRPRGSKNKVNNIMEVSKKAASGGDCKIAGPKKCGRPKGSKNKQKNIVQVSQEVAGSADCEIAGPKKCGRPKGSMKKRKSLVCASILEGAGGITREGLENKMLSNLCQEHIEYTQPVVRGGRPKGSRNKKIKLAFQDMVDEVRFANKESDKATCAVGEEQKDHGSDIGKPIGLDNDKATLASDRNQETPNQTLAQDEVQNDKSSVKPKRGRPKGSKNKMKSIANKARNKFGKVRNMRGRPKGSLRKKNETAYSLDSQNERNSLDGRTSTEAAYRNDVDLQRGHCSQEELLRMLSVEHKNIQGVGVEETIDYGLRSSGLMVSCLLYSCSFNLIPAMSRDACTMAVLTDFL